MHAIVSFVCYSTGIADELMLTLLTMFLVVMLCFRRRVGVLFMAIAVILVNPLGFSVGMGLASLLSLLPLPVTVVHSLSTLVCTEILGWSTEFCALRFGSSAGPGASDGRGLRWLLLAFVLIIMVRLVLIFAVSGFQGPRTFVIEMLLDYIFSCVIIVWVAEYAIRSREQAEREAEKANLACSVTLSSSSRSTPTSCSILSMCLTVSYRSSPRRRRATIPTSSRRFIVIC